MHRIIGLVALASSVTAGQSVAQSTSASVPITAPLERQYVGDLTLLHDKVLALAGAIPADKYSWRPSNDVRTVSQVLMHMAGEWYFLCPRSVGKQPPTVFPGGGRRGSFGTPTEAFRLLEQITAKDSVISELKNSWAYCSSQLAAIDPAALVPDSLPSKMGFPRVVLLVSGDQHEHLGQLIAYARSVGVAPPWSK